MLNIKNLFKIYKDDLTPSKEQEDRMFVTIFHRMPVERQNWIHTIMQENFLKFSTAIITSLVLFIPLAIIVNKNSSTNNDIASESVALKDETLGFQNKSGEISRDTMDEYMMLQPEDLVPTAPESDMKTESSSSSDDTASGSASTIQAPEQEYNVIPRTGVDNNTLPNGITENDSVESQIFSKEGDLISTLSGTGVNESTNSINLEYGNSDELKLLKLLLILFFYRI